MAPSFYTHTSGALFVAPGGQSEQGSAVRAAGCSWAALDVADGHAPADWHESVRQFVAAGMRTPLWGRVANMSVAELLELAATNHLPCLLNIEDEFKTTSPTTYERQIRAFRAAHPTYTREIVLVTGGWLYNDVDYSAIAHRPVLLEVFVEDMRIAPADLPRVTADCIAHARIKGFRDVGVMFQTYHGAEPGWYAYWGSRPRSWFTGDVIGAQQAWPAWRVPA